MKKLKNLIVYGTDGEILSYIKGDFSTRIDEYIDIERKIQQLKRELLELTKIGHQRQDELAELRAEMDRITAGMQNDPIKLDNAQKSKRPEALKKADWNMYLKNLKQGRGVL